MVAPAGAQETSGGARHLYVHVPFCKHRCGYCDFVTAVGRHDEHGGYVDALLREFERERHHVAERLDTVFLGGGTPTYLESTALRRLLKGLPLAGEVTVEANPETVTNSLAERLLDAGVTRISLGAQTFDAGLLATLERQATPQVVREAFATLRRAGFTNISLDLIYGIPGQCPEQLEHDLDVALALQPEHISAYELEAKPGTRFTKAHGPELARQAAGLEDYIERVVGRLQGEGYRWYETANFCRTDAAGVADLRSRHNLGYWRGADYVGIGVGAVSTVGQLRWKNGASVSRYASALASDAEPTRAVEPLSPSVRTWERAMLGLRLDEPLVEADVSSVLDPAGLERMVDRGLAQRVSGTILLTPRGRLLGSAVTVEVLRELGETEETVGAERRMSTAAL